MSALAAPNQRSKKAGEFFDRIGDARLRTYAVCDQAVGDVVGATVELAEGGVLPFEVNGYPIGANLGVVARDVSDRQNVGKAFALEHASLPIVSCRRDDSCTPWLLSTFLSP